MEQETIRLYLIHLFLHGNTINDYKYAELLNYLENRINVLKSAEKITEFLTNYLGSYDVINAKVYDRLLKKHKIPLYL